MNKKFLILDVETANTLDDPLVYDIGFAVIDGLGNVFETGSYVIADTFLNPEIMASAYFAEKIPQYQKEIKEGKRTLRKLKTVKFIIWDIIKKYDIQEMVAHNARFDYMALATSQRYYTKSKWRYFLPYGVKVLDTLKMARLVFSDDDDYLQFCNDNNYLTKYNKPRFTAEILTRFLTGENNFEEEHTGLADVMIEKEIFKRCFSVVEDGYLW